MYFILKSLILSCYYIGFLIKKDKYILSIIIIGVVFVGIMLLHCIVEAINIVFKNTPYLKFIVQFEDGTYAIRRIAGMSGPVIFFTWEYLDLQYHNPFSSSERRSYWWRDSDTYFSHCKGSMGQIKSAYEKYFSPSAKLKVKSSKCLKTVEDE